MRSRASKGLLAAITNLAELFNSATAAATAAEAGQMPRNRHLTRLGIDVDAYRAIGRH